MKHISRWAVICCFLAMNLLGQSFAGDHLDKSTLEKLIKGNTLEGTKTISKATYKMYFEPTGEFTRTDSRKNEVAGDWYIENDGTLCTTVNKRKCRTVKQRKDGGYDVYNAGNVLVRTIDKVSPGDPYNLH